MFANSNDVLTITGKVISQEVINRAQNLLEMYVNKTEAEITKTKDIALMKKAVAYQSVYMYNNEDIVYEQIASRVLSQNDSYVTFKVTDETSPWIAPLAVMACKKLSFIRTRSIVTGKIDPASIIDVAWETI